MTRVSRRNLREFWWRVFRIGVLLVMIILGVAPPYGAISLGQADRQSLNVGVHWPSTNAIGPLWAGTRNGVGVLLADRGQTVVQRTTLMIAGAPTVDANGVKSYAVTSVFLGSKATTVRVLEPNTLAPGKPRRSLYVLPVEFPGVTSLSSKYSDGLEELRLLNVHNRYNVTLIAPSFDISPWYGDHPTKIERRLESFIVRDLVPFGDSFQASGETQRWLIGFSKSGTGALSLILRHPQVFSLVAAWDAPAQLTTMSSHEMVENFGTEENFDRYEIPALVVANGEALRNRNRIWISGDNSAWTTHMVRLSAQMTWAGVPHTFVRNGSRRHHWGSGWLKEAVSWLDANAVSVDDYQRRQRAP